MGEAGEIGVRSALRLPGVTQSDATATDDTRVPGQEAVPGPCCMPPAWQRRPRPGFLPAAAKRAAQVRQKDRRK